jgi:hypothetical protein
MFTARLRSRAVARACVLVARSERSGGAFSIVRLMSTDPNIRNDQASRAAAGKAPEAGPQGAGSQSAKGITFDEIVRGMDAEMQDRISKIRAEQEKKAYSQVRSELSEWDKEFGNLTDMPLSPDELQKLRKIEAAEQQFEMQARMRMGRMSEEEQFKARQTEKANNMHKLNDKRYAAEQFKVRERTDCQRGICHVALALRALTYALHLYRFVVAASGRRSYGSCEEGQGG